MTHWLVEEKTPTVVERSRGITYTPALVDRVQVRVDPPKLARYDQPNARRRLELVDRLKELGVRTPKATTAAVQAYHQADTPWQFPDNLPELPTLVAESKAAHQKTVEQRRRDAYKAIGAAIVDNADTLYNHLAKLVTTTTDPHIFAQALTAADSIRYYGYGVLHHMAGARFRRTPPGDAVWVIGDLPRWIDDGCPQPTPTLLPDYDGQLFTPAEVVAHLEALPTQVLAPVVA